MKTKKLSLVTILAVLMLVFVTAFAISFNSKKASAAVVQTNYAKALAQNGGTDMGEAMNAYQINAFTQTPVTFEALVYLHDGNNWLGTNRDGAIIGGFAVGGADHVNIEVGKDAAGYANRLRFYWKNGEIDWWTNNAVITEHAWTHIVFVRDSSSNSIKCYVNGQSVAGTYVAGSGIGSNFSSFNVNHWIGRDGRNGWSTVSGTSKNIKNNFFNGEINYIGVSSILKTASDVTSAYNGNRRLINATDSNALYAKELGARTYYRALSPINATPNTFTATINMPTYVDVAHWEDMQNIGRVFSMHNKAGSVHNIEMAIDNNGHVKFIWDEANVDWNKIVAFFDTPVSGISADKLNVRTGKDVHIAIVKDDSARTFRLYLDGVHVSNASYYLYEYDNNADGYVDAAYTYCATTNNLARTSGPYDSVQALHDLAWENNNATTSTKISSTAHWLCDRIVNLWKGTEGTINFVPDFGFAIGEDVRTEKNPLPFPGKIYNVAMYSNSMTAAQISSEYAVKDKTTINKTNSSYSGVLANWVFDSTQQELRYNKNNAHAVKDYSGNGLDAILCTVGAYFLPETNNWQQASNDEYTIIYLPDTQCTVRSQPQYTDAMFDWIVANKNSMNLQFVMGVGDIVDGVGITSPTTSAQQWDRMALNYKKLSDAGIMWSSPVGNHDYDIDGCPYPMTVRQANVYNEHFGYNSTTLNNDIRSKIVARFSTNQLHAGVAIEKGDSSNNDMLNAIFEYSATTKDGKTKVDYLIVALEMGPSPETLNWATSIISQPKYANHRVIFNTHSLIFADGDFGDSTATNNPTDYWAKLADANNKATNGDFMWENFMAKNSNMFLAASGHIETDMNLYRKDVGENGNTVLSMLCDGQSSSYHSDRDSTSGWGDPLILVAKVNEKTKTIKYYYYNPVLDMMFGAENLYEYDFSNWDTATRYDVEKSADINYDLDNAKANSIVEFTINETAGYAYNTPVVTSNGQTLTLTQNGDVYSFIMPKDAVSISVDKLNLNNYTMPSSLTLTLGESTDLSSYLPTTQGVEITFNNANLTANGTEITAVKTGKSLMTITFTEFDVVKTCGITIEKATTSSSSSSSSVKPSSSASSSSKVESSSSSSSSSQQVTSSSQSTQSSQPSSQEPQSSTNKTQPSVGCGANFTGTGLFIVLAGIAVAIFLFKKKA